MIRSMLTLAAILLGAVTAAAEAPAPLPAPFTLTSPRFADNSVLPRDFAGNLPANPNCVGRNLAPPLVWKGIPAGTKSFAFLMIDPEGRGGLGVVHWIAYNIPASRTSFAANEITRAPVGYSGGTSTQGLDHYIGPCTPPGTSYHHYTFVIIATDLEPGALPPGLTRDQLNPLLVAHTKGSAGFVTRFKHP